MRRLLRKFKYAQPIRWGRPLFVGAGAFVAGGALAFSYFFAAPVLIPLVYDADTLGGKSGASVEEAQQEKKPAPFVATHMPTPEPLRAIYITSWVAGTKDWRASLVKLIEETELNAVVIDIKDYSGRIAFSVSDPILLRYGAAENRIPDIRNFLRDLHERGIYAIGRITVFQDPHLAAREPRWAVKKESATSTLWADYKGLSYIDPGMHEAWEYITALARESFEAGFDELNFDYIRFPSDGNMRDIYYPASELRVNADPLLGKAIMLREFFAHLHAVLADPDTYPSNELRDRRITPALSADLFGMTMTNKDDLNIGQILEYVEPYFDYISPMVYPSHYPRGFNGYQKPATVPYEIVRFSLDRGVTRLIAASSSPAKLRPWLQDFDLGAVYDADMVRAQIKATYDAGLTSWMLWDPANTYTRGALLPAGSVDQN